MERKEDSVAGHAEGFALSVGQLVWAQAAGSAKAKKALWPAILRDPDERALLPPGLPKRRSVKQEPVEFFASKAGSRTLSWGWSPGAKLLPFFAHRDAVLAKASAKVADAAANLHSFVARTDGGEADFRRLEQAYFHRLSENSPLLDIKEEKENSEEPKTSTPPLSSVSSEADSVSQSGKRRLSAQDSDSASSQAQGPPKKRYKAQVDKADSAEPSLSSKETSNPSAVPVEVKTEVEPPSKEATDGKSKSACAPNGVSEAGKKVRAGGRPRRRFGMLGSGEWLEEVRKRLAAKGKNRGPERWSEATAESVAAALAQSSVLIVAGEDGKAERVLAELLCAQVEGGEFGGRGLVVFSRQAEVQAGLAAAGAAGGVEVLSVAAFRHGAHFFPRLLCGGSESLMGTLAGTLGVVGRPVFVRDADVWARLVETTEGLAERVAEALAPATALLGPTAPHVLQALGADEIFSAAAQTILTLQLPG